VHRWMSKPRTANRSGSPPGDLAEDFSPRFLDQAVDRCSARLPAFIYLVTEAWRRRNLAQWHKRLMLGATILVVFGPGFSRIPFSPPTFWGFTIQLFAGLVLLFAPLFIWDRRTVGKIHPATWTGFHRLRGGGGRPGGPDRDRLMGSDRAAAPGHRELSGGVLHRGLAFSQMKTPAQGRGEIVRTERRPSASPVDHRINRAVGDLDRQRP
jgi:hypothetical protein